MRLLLIWLAVASLLEVLLWAPLIWRIRRVLACILIPSLALLSGLLFGSYPSVWTALVLFFSLYRLINLLRVIEGRLHARYLYHATRRTSYWLISFQIMIVGVAGLQRWYPQSGVRWLYGLVLAQLLAALIIFASTRRHLRTTQLSIAEGNLADSQLPTLSVAIPARNETADLEACLRSLVASDYPKLEVLVLDDCSQDKRTPGIIREFAQNGVRFIAGQAPPEQWLAKNYAYHQLSEAANGDLLLFCGVDTRFQPGSLRAMVEVAHQKRKTMVSFIPRNRTPSSWNIAATLFQPARYAWELSLPRRLFKRPPVLSTCWLITANLLKSAGGFAAVTKSTSPESHLARFAATHQDGYSFVQAGDTVDLLSEKSVPEQRATAIRTRYPQLHRRPELAGLLSLLELIVLIGPFFTLLGCLWTQQWSAAVISGLAVVLLMATHAQIVQLTYRRFLIRGIWLLPFTVAHDIAILNYSMWQYEFREVIWKGRNVCVPVMQVIPKLPKIN